MDISKKIGSPVITVHIQKVFSILFAALFAVNMGTAVAGDDGAAEPQAMANPQVLGSGIFDAKIEGELEAEPNGGSDNLFPMEIERYPRMAQASSGESQESNGNSSGGEKPEDWTGTDPRDFGTKFMPFYRYVETENDIKVNLTTLLGVVQFSNKLAVGYEIPVAKSIDITDTAAFQSGSPGTLLPGGGSEIPPNGIPFTPGGGDGSVSGLGDSIFRLLYKPDWMKGFLNSSWIYGAEVTVPTATNVVLGAESFILAPMLTWVWDTPFDGFIAAMNFYEFDAFKDNSREDVSRYRGRGILMQPLSKPGPGVFDGIYLLTELQPVYDFENDEFSFWVAPELGKNISEGNIIYAKSGWGVDPEESDRKFTFEMGWRYIF
jgi:hypothetical protein